MDARNLLGEFAGRLLAGDITVVDLTAVLGPDTPLIKLPPELAVDTPQVEIHPISAYDKNGPFWAWNWLKLGEHSGTHFDAPIHWITGKDYADGATDTIPVQNFVAPVNVIDCSQEAAADHDFLLTVEHIKAWEAEHGDDQRRRMGGDAHRLVQAQRFGEGSFSMPTRPARTRRGRPPKRSNT